MIPELLLAFQAAATPRPPVVTVRPPARVVMEAGAQAEARLGVSVAAGFHVQANPAADRYLIPLRLELPAHPQISAEPRYPPGQPYRLQGADKDLLTYEGSFELAVKLTAARAAPVGDAVLEGRLQYQACDARVCLRPTSVPVTLAVRVAAPKR